MKILSVTEARSRLGHWCKRAAEGEEIGIVIGSQVIALRQVGVHADDYAQTEYGVSAQGLDRAIARMDAETAKARKAGDLLTLDQFIDEIDGPNPSKGGKSGRKTARRRKDATRRRAKVTV